jgi:hypothetical protein
MQTAYNNQQHQSNSGTNIVVEAPSREEKATAMLDANQPKPLEGLCDRTRNWRVPVLWSI